MFSIGPNGWWWMNPRSRAESKAVKYFYGNDESFFAKNQLTIAIILMIIGGIITGPIKVLGIIFLAGGLALVGESIYTSIRLNKVFSRMEAGLQAFDFESPEGEYFRNELLFYRERELDERYQRMVLAPDTRIPPSGPIRTFLTDATNRALLTQVVGLKDEEQICRIREHLLNAVLPLRESTHQLIAAYRRQAINDRVEAARAEADLERETAETEQQQVDALFARLGLMG